MIYPVPGIPIEQQPERVLLRMCLWGEARGESNYGKAAVLWTIMNRVSQTGHTIADTILAHSAKGTYQFTSFDPGDPNRIKLLKAHIESPTTWGACDAVCELVEAGIVTDPTHGADHYYNPSVCSPAWGRGNPNWKELATVGNHVFGSCP